MCYQDERGGGGRQDPMTRQGWCSYPSLTTTTTPCNARGHVGMVAAVGAVGGGAVGSGRAHGVVPREVLQQVTEDPDWVVGHHHRWPGSVSRGLALPVAHTR